MIYKEQLQEVYRGLDARSVALTEQLKQLKKRTPKGSLSLEIKHGKPTFVMNSTRDGKRRRDSLRNAPGTVNDILTEELLKLELAEVNKNKTRLRSCIRDYGMVGTDRYFERLKKRWPKLPYEYIEALERSRELDAWALEEYEHFSYKDETKRHRTSRGLLVRSKSEQLIAEKLYEHRIPFRYEQVLRIGNTNFGPDFTIRRGDGKLFYWEHEGMTHSDEYMRYQEHKHAMYRQEGIVPWDNLIVTYDSPDGTVDVRIVESEIRNKLMW